MSSNVSGLGRGDVVKDDVMLDVPAGKFVRIFRPSGGTQEVVGPQKRKVGDIVRGDRMNEPLWREMLQQLANEKGRGGTAATGATRGATK